MTGADLFSAGFAWDAVAPAATPVATPASARPTSEPQALSQGIATADATPFSSDFAWNSGGVASVAGVANHDTEAQVSQPSVAGDATDRATPESADFRGSAVVTAPTVAGVASVANWSAGVEMMSSRPVAGVAPQRWRELSADARALLQNWGADFVKFGWSTLEVFGVNANPQHRRLDVPGLLPLLRGRTIEAIDQDTALIRGIRQDTMTFQRRLVASGGVPVWFWILGARQ